ncbi:hypothetical protein E2C01_052268 [Portunus trituberculatus]|uniref:Uncharacterized protein n=1 Tax=Portunus trituberculatus TaxID=210409 RepID=A0A5B7GH40_PORTR|nr:hypothetical protein [Portunus trituberculatus]
MFLSSPCICFRWHTRNYDFPLFQFLCFDCYFHYFHHTITILSRTIISTPPPPFPFLSLLQLLHLSSSKLTWLSSFGFVSSMHITSGLFLSNNL